MAQEASSRSTTAESLLGVLSLGPMSGYDIRRMMAGSTANFWRESFGQIYPALKKLVEQGLAEVVEDHSSGERQRKVYRLTRSGNARLREWLAVACSVQVPREELLLKLFFGDKAPPGAMREAVWLRRQIAETDLARYSEIEKGIAAQRQKHPAAPYWQMTLEFGKANARALLGWCDCTLRELEGLEEGPNVDRQSRAGKAKGRAQGKRGAGSNAQ